MPPSKKAPRESEETHLTLGKRRRDFIDNVHVNVRTHVDVYDLDKLWYVWVCSFSYFYLF